MAKFRTIVEVNKIDKLFGYGSSSVLLGSCFTENIGNRLKYFKFRSEVNPFGVLYNPVSISNSIKILIEKRKFTESDLNFEKGIWYSLYHHSSFSMADRNECINIINTSIERAAGNLRKADFLFVTFGTARGYKFKESGKVVSNCHKLPAERFDHFLLTVDEIVNSYVEVVKHLREINPGITIVFTISPVRHWKDGPRGNQLSKAVLHIAIDELLKKLDNSIYFPAYEIVLDDLRDYRFYDEDMLHINKIGTDYVWEKFCSMFIDSKAYTAIQSVDSIQKALLHRSFNLDKIGYHKFLTNLEVKIHTIESQFPEIDFSDEKITVSNRLNELNNK